MQETDFLQKKNKNKPGKAMHNDIPDVENSLDSYNLWCATEAVLDDFFEFNSEKVPTTY